MHLITVHCLTLTNFPGLLLTWPALTITGSSLAVSVSLTAPRGAGLSSLPGAPLPHIMAIPRTPHWPVTTHSQAGKNNNHRKLAFPCLSNLQEKSFKKQCLLNNDQIDDTPNALISGQDTGCVSSDTLKRRLISRLKVICRAISEDKNWPD